MKYFNSKYMIAKDIKAGRIGGIILFDRDVALMSDVRNIKSPSQEHLKLLYK